MVEAIPAGEETVSVTMTISELKELLAESMKDRQYSLWDLVMCLVALILLMLLLCVLLICILHVRRYYLVEILPATKKKKSKKKKKKGYLSILFNPPR